MKGSRRRSLRALTAMLVILPHAGAAQGQFRNSSPDCGPDAFSSAEVVERRPPRRGPLTAVPQTLCADLAPQVPPAPVDIQVYPGLIPPVGRPGPGDPYGESRRGPFPRP